MDFILNYLFGKVQWLCCSVILIAQHEVWDTSFENVLFSSKEEHTNIQVDRQLQSCADWVHLTKGEKYHLLRRNYFAFKQGCENGSENLVKFWWSNYIQVTEQVRDHYWVNLNDVSDVQWYLGEIKARVGVNKIHFSDDNFGIYFW